MKVLDLFSGIGGFALATEWAGGETIAFSEVASFPSKVLAARWPEIPNLGDITKLCRRCYDCQPDPNDDESLLCPRCGTDFGECDCIGTDQFTDTYGFPDVVVGGVPCQPASLVGKRRGTSDERWLWPETLRVIGELQPRFAILENPRAILTLEGGDAFRGILASFADLGYDVQWHTLPASALGAGHRRERLWILASHSNRPGLEGLAGDGETIWRTEEGRYPASPGLQPNWEQIRRWALESCVCRSFDGLPERMGDALDIDTKLGYWVSHAKKTFSYSPEVLCLLQQGSYEEAIRLGLGIPEHIQEKKILRPTVYGSRDDSRTKNEKWMETGGSEVQEGRVREVWENQEATRAPRESKMGRQHPGQSNDPLCFLPHERALERGGHSSSDERLLQNLWRACGKVPTMRPSLPALQEIWKSASNQDRDWITVAACNGGPLFHPRYGSPPVVKNLSSRALRDQLTAVGNSLVPQVALVWLRAIHKILQQDKQQQP